MTEPAQRSLWQVLKSPKVLSVARVQAWNSAYYTISARPSVKGAHFLAFMSTPFVGWLNEARRAPWWFHGIQRSDADTLITHTGHIVRAAGPLLFDEERDPGTKDWRQDASQDARIERGLLIEAIVKEDRALLDRCLYKH